MSTDELHTLTGAYAVHALDAPEERDFEQHMAGCDACALEVAELRATAVRLGLGVSVPPPPQMREAVLRRIGGVRQEPPSQSGPAGTGTVRGGVRRARRLPRLALAACLAAAVALGGVAAWQYQRASDATEQSARAEQRGEALTRLLTAPDARTVSSRDLPKGSEGTVVVSRSRDEAAFVASGMPDPPSGKVYQLWFNDGDSMRAAGLMDDSSKTAAVMLEGKVDKASGMGITVEPAGGSPQPTSSPVALINFPA